ncbi:MAG: hypothetical protein ACFB15_10760 [Cyclobacteriaceae bacterium]
MKAWSKITLLVYLLCLTASAAYAQIDSSSIRIPQLLALKNNQDLILQATEGAVYLVHQEYQLQSPSGELVGRGIFDHFGDIYRIGILVDRDLWMPATVASPWQIDPNFREYEASHKPVNSITKVKQINTADEFRPFNSKNLLFNTQGSLTSFKPGKIGLNLSDSLPIEGKLVVYFIESDENPNEAEVKSSTITLNRLEWKDNGVAEIENVRFKDRTILGGAMFTEVVRLGAIEVKLVAVYTDQQGAWTLQALNPLVAPYHSSN